MFDFTCYIIPPHLTQHFVNWKIALQFTLH